MAIVDDLKRVTAQVEEQARHIERQDRDIAKLRALVIGESQPTEKATASNGDSVAHTPSKPKSQTRKSKAVTNGQTKRRGRPPGRPAGERQDQFLRAVTANPGATVAQVADV